jgi:predicted SnoaL-like aldol condensation-catalyzing enzyme
MDVSQDRPAGCLVAADLVRIDNGRLAEHWAVLQDEATKAESKSGLPMFGDHFTQPRTE